MKRYALLVVAALVWGNSLAFAQNGQVYWGKGMYPPTMPTPQGYYGYPPTAVQPTQYPMAGYPQNPYGYPAAVPVMPAPRPMYPYYGANTYGANPNYGVNYYPMPNPMSYTPTSMPYNAAPNSRPASRPSGWPAPSGTSAAQENVELPVDEPNGYVDIHRPEVKPFHRQPNEHCFGSLGYVGMFFRPMRFSGPLVTTGAATDPAPGALGQPGTNVLFGGDTIDFGLMSGIQAQLGMFLDDHNHYSIEAGGFWVFQGTRTFNIQSDSTGNPSISRPVFNVATGVEGAFLNSLPNTVTGNLNVDLRSEFGGFEINARRHWYVEEYLHADALFGFRYLRLAERMRIVENLQTIAPAFVTFQQVPIGLGNTLTDQDSFDTTNQFFGPQIGGRLSWEQKWFTASAFAKVGLGVTHQNTTINGSTSVVTPTGNVGVPGGILALPTNIGSHSRTVFGLVPEFGLNLGVELTECVRLNLGYSFLMWNHVVRPGSQFDRNVNPALAPSTPPPVPTGGSQAPIYRFNDEFFWVNSFNIGLEFHY